MRFELQVGVGSHPAPEGRRNVAHGVSRGSSLASRPAPEGRNNKPRGSFLRPSGAEGASTRVTHGLRRGLHSSAPPGLTASPNTRGDARRRPARGKRAGFSLIEFLAVLALMA